MKKLIYIVALTVIAVNLALAEDKQKPKSVTIDGVTGYQDTPLEPGSQWPVSYTHLTLPTKRIV